MMRVLTIAMALLISQNLFAGSIDFGVELCDPFYSQPSLDNTDKTITKLEKYVSYDGEKIFIGYGRITGGHDVEFIYFDPDIGSNGDIVQFLQSSPREEAIDKYYNIDGTLFCPGNHVNISPPIYPVYKIAQGLDPSNAMNWQILELGIPLAHKCFFGQIGDYLYVSGNDAAQPAAPVVEYYTPSLGIWRISYYPSGQRGSISELFEFSVGGNDYIYGIGMDMDANESPQLIRTPIGSHDWECMDSIFETEPGYFYKATVFNDSIYVVTFPDTRGKLWCTDGYSIGYQDMRYDDDVVRIFDMKKIGTGASERLMLLAWEMSSPTTFEKGSFYSTYDGKTWCGPKQYDAEMTGYSGDIPFTAFEYSDGYIYAASGNAAFENPLDSSGFWRSEQISELDPPGVTRVDHLGGKIVRVIYDETIDPETGCDVENYSITTMFGTSIGIENVKLSETDDNVVFIKTVEDLNSARYGLSICCVEDVSWNCIKPYDTVFQTSQRPCSDYLIDEDQFGPSGILIYDIRGRLVRNINDRASINDIRILRDLPEIQSLASGLYLIRRGSSKSSLMSTINGRVNFISLPD